MTEGKNVVRFKVFHLLERAISEGLEIGWNRAHKHVDDPSPDFILEQQEREIMNKLDEIVDFDDDR